MITYKQLTLVEIFDDCQNKFDNDKYQFLSLLDEKTLHADLLLAGITQLVTVLVADKIHQQQYIRSLKPLIA